MTRLYIFDICLRRDANCIWPMA